jgi:hypothetical protein
MRYVTLIATLSVLCVSAHASGDHHAAPTMPKDFNTLKQLVGTWKGTTQMDGKDVPTTVVYELTSGGTAISEKMMPGTPHEMISMYHKDGTTVGMTHYCAMGNQPHMQLTQSTPGKMTFEVKQPIGIESMKAPHMHSLTLTMIDADTLKQEWKSLGMGKKDETAVFELKRVK